MKTQFLRFLVLSFALVIFSVSAFAQSGNLMADIPFNFYVGNEKLSAGKYEIKRVSPNAFLLIGKDEKVKILAQTPLTTGDASSASSERLVFNNYGSKYFLREVFSNRNTVGRALYESKSEKILRQGLPENEGISKKTKPEQISVGLKTK
ncbi:MAG: hypothetical protein K1X72_29160 [Pyrinomonadaceae bacterium]|nr:hypothetical protein [Pyrinomonadaceae bacterium]